MSAPLRVAFDLLAIPERETGIAVYASELAAALQRRPDIELERVESRLKPEGLQLVRFPWRALTLSAWEQLRLGPAFRGSADVIHGPSFSVPVLKRRPTVATVHDLAVKKIPALHSWRSLAYHRTLLATARTATAVIVPTRCVAADAMQHLGIPSRRIHVVLEAGRSWIAAATPEATEGLRRRLGEERPYLLCVGTLSPHKRTVDALRALVILREQGQDVALLVAGASHVAGSGLARETRRLGLEGAVRFLGYVPDDDLAALYTGAVALVFPSLFEGFGLPPIEAMACGTPVIAADAPAANEVLAGAAWFVPVRHPAAIAAAARALLNPPTRGEWAARSLGHAACFSWDRAAAATAEVYRLVARAG